MLKNSSRLTVRPQTLGLLILLVLVRGFYQYLGVPRITVLIVVHCELAQDEKVLRNGRESANQPRQVGDDVPRFRRCEQDRCRVCHVCG